MSQPIIIEVIGDPKPQPRPRSFALRGKGGKVIMGKHGPIIRVHESAPKSVPAPTTGRNDD